MRVPGKTEAFINVFMLIHQNPWLFLAILFGLDLGQRQHAGRQTHDEVCMMRVSSELYIYSCAEYAQQYPICNLTAKVNLQRCAVS